MKIINPATEAEQPIEETPLGNLRMVEQSRRVWGDRSLPAQIRVLSRIAGVVETQRDSLVACITQDLRKPTKLSQLEVDYTLTHLEFFCRQAESWLASKQVDGGYVQYDPLGVIAVISPWNRPLIVPVVAIVPALLAGNAVVFKTSENTLHTGIELGKLVDSLDDQPATTYGGGQS